MKNKIKEHTRILFLLLIASAALMPTSIAKAAIIYPEYHPQDLINNESLYNEVVVLTIENEETELLSQINFSKFSQLKEIWLNETVILDGSIIDLDNAITLLNINNTVVNLATIDLGDFNSIDLVSTYIIGDKVESLKVHNIDPLNEEYKLNPDNTYGLKNNEAKINNIAKEIYSQSDGTDADIIRLVTLYVLEHLEYDHDNLYTDLPLYESIIDHEKGVCAHYSDFESRLLNKLGIFAIHIGGCVNLSDCMNFQHAWDIVYTNNNWYYIDPTWIDDNDSIEALRDNDHQSSSMVSWYMIPANETYSLYNTQRKLDFTMYNSIPTEYRSSKISIMDELETKNKETDKNEEEEKEDKKEKTVDKPETKSSPNNSLKTPDTGFSTTDNSFATISIIFKAIAAISPLLYLILIIIKRVIRKIKINNF